MRRGVVGSDWSSDSDPVICVPKSGGREDNPAAKHYQIAFEFERRGGVIDR
jgi:hypothetical protein